MSYALPSPPPRQRGFTMLETLTVLVVAVIALAAAAAAGSKLIENSKITTEVSNITQMIDNFRKLKDGDQYDSIFAPLASGDCPDCDMSAQYLYKVFPDNMPYDANKKRVLNSWGGYISITYAINSPKGILVAYSKVPSAACSQLILSVLHTEPPDEIYLQHNTDVEKGWTPASIATECNKQNDNHIEFSYDNY